LYLREFLGKKGIAEHGVEYYYISKLEKIDLRLFNVKEFMMKNRLNRLTHIIQKD